MARDIYRRYGGAAHGAPRLGLCASPLLVWMLSGCALLQPLAPAPVSVVCDQQDREIVRLQQTLTEKDAEIQQLRAQRNVQAKELKQTTGEVARAEVRLRRLATQADAASQLAEVEVALHGMQTKPLARSAAAQQAQAQQILDAAAASFAQGDYGAAVELAAQSQAIIEMLAGRRGSAAAIRDAVEMPFQISVALRVRIDSHLRAGPGRSAEVLGVLRQGALVQAHAHCGEWLSVQTEDGRAGWVYGALLEAPHPTAK